MESDKGLLSLVKDLINIIKDKDKQIQMLSSRIEEYIQNVGLKSGDIVLFEDASGGGPQTAGLLINRGIRAVIVDTPLSHLSEEELVHSVIPVINAEEVELQRVDEFAFISRKKFEKQLQSFIAKVREEARQRGEDELVELVERYRREIER